MPTNFYNQRVVLDASEKTSQWRLFFSKNRLVALTWWRLLNILRVLSEGSCKIMKGHSEGGPGIAIGPKLQEVRSPLCRICQPSSCIFSCWTPQATVFAVSIILAW